MSPLDDLVAETDSGAALEALRSALSRWKITANELPALFVAGWARRMDDTLEEFQDSDGLRALPEADHNIAVLFFKEESLMTLVVYFLWKCPDEIRNLAALLDPVMGPREFYIDHYQDEPSREKLRERWSAAEDAYHASVMDNAGRLMSEVFARPPSPKRPPECHVLRTRGRARPAPRQREHRSTRRRASASRAGPDDPAEPEPPVAVATEAVAG